MRFTVGGNQPELLADGAAEAMLMPVADDSRIRNKVDKCVRIFMARYGKYGC
jgi:hypothetical protein